MYNFTDASSNWYWHFEIESEVPIDVNGERFEVWQVNDEGNYVELPSGTSSISDDFIEWTYVDVIEDGQTIDFSKSLLGYRLKDVFGRFYHVRHRVEYEYPPDSCP